jgi:hypothetical protein
VAATVHGTEMALDQRFLKCIGDKKRLRLRRLVITLRGLSERLAGDLSLDIHRVLQAVTRYVIGIASFVGSSHRPVITRYSAFPSPLTSRAIQKR